MIFQLSVDELTATVSQEGPIHCDLMDEMATRCLRMLIDAYASLDQSEDADDAEG